jgi:hypothetical protein
MIFNLLFLVNASVATTVFLVRHGEANGRFGNLSIDGQLRMRCLDTNVFKGFVKYEFSSLTGLMDEDGVGRIIVLSGDKASRETVGELSKSLDVKVESNCKTLECIVDNVLSGEKSGSVIIAAESNDLEELVVLFGLSSRVYTDERYDLLWELDTDTKSFSESSQDCSSYGLYSDGNLKYVANADIMDDGIVRSTTITLLALMFLLSVAGIVFHFHYGGLSFISGVNSKAKAVV